MANRSGRGRMGAGGTCICLACGHREPHSPGTACREQRCPECGKALIREGSEHHQPFLAKRETGGKQP